MTPSPNLQIVVWIEDAAGRYVDTAYITRLTGSLGMGNRPGIMEFNSGPLWPYGRRTTTFPVWAHRHGMTWPEVTFQDGDEDNLSHPIVQSSVESYYCRPILPEEELWDAETCATLVYSDKGALQSSGESLYPPRSDLVGDPLRDDPSVAAMAGLNPFDSISRATPAGGSLYRFLWPIPEAVPDGDYVAWLEVAKEFDQNEHYDYPPPPAIPWSEYGAPYRGQPSVLYRLPFSIADGEMVSRTLDYAGYGDPDGLDGELREPDGTITTDRAGSGAGRLLVTMAGGDMFRVELSARTTEDEILPGAVRELQIAEAGADSMSLQFVAPGDDGLEGKVAGYEIRYRAGSPIDEENFETSTLLPAELTPAAPGSLHTFELPELLANTNYYVGVRAIDECVNRGALATIHFVTPPPESAAVGRMLRGDRRPRIADGRRGRGFATISRPFSPPPRPSVSSRLRPTTSLGRRSRSSSRPPRRFAGRPERRSRPRSPPPPRAFAAFLFAEVRPPHFVAAMSCSVGARSARCNSSGGARTDGGGPV